MGTQLLWCGLIALAVLAFACMFKSSAGGGGNSLQLSEQDRLLREQDEQELVRRAQEHDQHHQWNVPYGADPQDQLLAAQGFDPSDDSV